MAPSDSDESICIYCKKAGPKSSQANSLIRKRSVQDLDAYTGIRVDPEERTVRAEPGLTLGEFDRETQGFGLATTLGVASTTGIAGLTLGGDLGWLMGKYGLACDNLISADLVTADSSLVRASAGENADLFWGIRGGSGNFGVVTSLKYRLHSVGPLILGGAVLYPLAKAKDFLRFFRDFAVATPDELSMQGGMFTFKWDTGHRHGGLLLRADRGR